MIGSQPNYEEWKLLKMRLRRMVMSSSQPNYEEWKQYNSTYLSINSLKFPA